MPLTITHTRAALRAGLDGEGEGDGPGGDLLLEVVDVLDLAGGDLGLEVLELVGLLGELGLDLPAHLDDLVDVVGDLLEVLLAETTRGHGGRADTDTHGGESRLVTGSGVLVAGNVDLLEDGLNTGTVEVPLLQVDEDHVVVGTVGDELEAEILEGVLELLGVLDDLLLVQLEVLGLSLLESNGKRGDGVVVGSTLVTGEDGEVDGTLKVVQGLLARLRVSAADALAEEDHSATRTTERLVGGGGDDVGVGEGRLVDAGSDETRDVGHVHHEVAANLVGDLAHAGVVDLTAVGGGTGNQDLGAIHQSVLLELVVVDETSVEVDTVGEGLEVCGNGRDLSLGGLVAVGQVATVGQVKTHEPLVGPHDGLVDLEVGGRSGQALDVDTPLLVIETKGVEGALLAKKLDGVNVLVTAVVAGTGVALGVFVRHGRTERIEDGAGCDILRGNEKDGLALTLDLTLLCCVSRESHAPAMLNANAP
jgi:hypothetical protein